MASQLAGKAAVAICYTQLLSQLAVTEGAARQRLPVTALQHLRLLYLPRIMEGCTCKAGNQAAACLCKRRLGSS